MEETIYSSTLIWQALGALNSFAVWVMPFFMFVVTALWFYKERSLISIASLGGGLLAMSSQILRILIPSVQSINLGYAEPAVEQNQLVWFFFLYGVNLGVLVFVVTVGYKLIFKNHITKLSI